MVSSCYEILKLAVIDIRLSLSLQNISEPTLVRRSCAIGVLWFTAACLQVNAAELPKPYDALGQVNLLDGLLSEKPDRYRLLVVDTFENLHPYAPRANSTELSDVRFVFKTPDDPAFLVERELIEGWSNEEPGFERSLMIHTSFTVPGRQSYWLRPTVPVRLRGQLVRGSIWVHSNTYRHRLFLLFENADGLEIKLPIANLHWNGWRRLSFTLPAELYRRGRRADNQYDHLFTGFLIQSHPLGAAGSVAIMLDNLLILSDWVEFQYPGYEYSDQWK